MGESLLRTYCIPQFSRTSEPIFGVVGPVFCREKRDGVWPLHDRYVYLPSGFQPHKAF